MKEAALAPESNNEVVQELRRYASATQAGMRTLQELEMGWVAGGDGQPVWPY
jgi:hypothetical protein